MTPTTEAEDRLRVWVEAQCREMRFNDRQAESFDALRSDYQAAIEAEARQQERERLRDEESDRTLRFAFMTPDEWAADALSGISIEDREALRRALLADPAEPEPSE